MFSQIKYIEYATWEVFNERESVLELDKLKVAPDLSWIPLL